MKVKTNVGICARQVWSICARIWRSPQHSVQEAFPITVNVRHIKLPLRVFRSSNQSLKIRIYVKEPEICYIVGWLLQISTRLPNWNSPHVISFESRHRDSDGFFYICIPNIVCLLLLFSFSRLGRTFCLLWFFPAWVCWLLFCIIFHVWWQLASHGLSRAAV